MSAEKGSLKDGVAGLPENSVLVEEFVRLNERHFNYCLEVTALQLALSKNCRRRICREARLNDLRVRLLPQVQARLDALENQNGGIIY